MATRAPDRDQHCVFVTAGRDRYNFWTGYLRSIPFLPAHIVFWLPLPDLPRPKAT